ncbi:MAG: hypothetical protein IH995_06995 [Proteobacteria bacterium]|nr:hypothetical protein [Pseudomonadota bacterium]
MILPKPILIGILTLIPALLSSQAMAGVGEWECVLETSFLCQDNTCEQVEASGPSYVFLEDESMGRCDQNMCWIKRGKIYDAFEYYTIIMETWWTDDNPDLVFETNDIVNGGESIFAKMSRDGSEYLEMWVGGAEVLISQGSCHELDPSQPQEQGKPE